MEQGTLYIIATPIGNLEDITYRAVRILSEEIDIAYCEDTRQTKKLLNHYGIKIHTNSLHTHSSDSKIIKLCDDIKSGTTVAYMTDSGTPGISDPGSKLVSFARDREINVIPIPGPSALSSIVSISGFQQKQVIFGGFLSKKKSKMGKDLDKLLKFNGIIVIYESPYRIKQLITVINSIIPDNRIFIGREMTKFYEEFYSGTVSEIFMNLDEIKEKGEFTIAISNKL